MSARDKASISSSSGDTPTGDASSSAAGGPSNLSQSRPAVPESPRRSIFGSSNSAGAAPIPAGQVASLRRASLQAGPAGQGSSSSESGSSFAQWQAQAGGASSSTPTRFFPRSLTVDSVLTPNTPPTGAPVGHAHRHRFSFGGSPAMAGRGARVVGHATPSSEALENSTEFERHSNPSASGFNLEGRSYRFHNTHDAASVPRSYTATSGTIRDSTALLAGMALMSDDEESNDSRIEERDESTSPDEAEGSTAPVDVVAKHLQPSSFASSSLRGPSNLSIAMSASAGTSPAATVKALHSNEGTPREPDHPTFSPLSSSVSAASKSISPIGSNGLPAVQSPAAVSEADVAATESTPLLAVPVASEGVRQRGPGRKLSRASSTSRSTSSSRANAQVGGPVTRADSRKVTRKDSISSTTLLVQDGGNDSGFSVRSGGRRQSGTSSFGHGPLAQASGEGPRTPGVGGDSSHMSMPPPSAPPHAQVHWAGLPSTDGGYADDDDEPLSLAWAVIPQRFRPGRGSRPLAELPSVKSRASAARESLRKLTWRDALDLSAEPIRVLPAVILGLLLNVLDGVSYGLIIFPNSYPIFSDFGGDGVSMFFITCVISQLVFSLGGSIFRGGNASMMIEVVPFFHILVQGIMDELGDEDPSAVISTTIVAFALSSIFAGIVFLLLGWFRLGLLIGFFPRHILVGCIGGVGVFLIETGMEVSGQLRSEEGFQWNWETLRYFTQSWEMVAHWAPALGLAILLRFITARFHHPLIFPAYFLIIPILFYILVNGALRQPFTSLREHGWVFDVGDAGDVPFYRFYSYFNFKKTSFRALWSTMPTQLALTFFSILHVPLNVPALAISVNEDNLDTDRELVAHGISNILAGLAGSVPNYLCYVNSVLFYRVGGGNRLSGLMLAAGTTLILFAGPGAIGYLPIVVVGALIFVLGIDLVKEALWDTVGRVNGWEYFTIWVIIAVMTYYDFVVGILVGIILACLFFVVQTSRRRTVRAVLDGSIARSTVRRHSTQRQFLASVGSQTQIVKLQGFLYFANISSVEELIRRALDIAQWQQNPIRFLMVDFSLVSGIDFSAAEAFTRIQRLLQAKDVLLVFCGLTPDSDVGDALRAVDMWADRGIHLEVFQNLNEALEWTENQYLRGMYASGLAAGQQFSQASLAAGGGLDVPDKKRQPAFALGETLENSPRRHHLHEAAMEATKSSSAAMAAVRRAAGPAEGGSGSGTSGSERPHLPRVQPLPLLLVTFQAYAGPDADEKIFVELATYFTPVHLEEGDVLWEHGDEPDAMYLIESGILKARYDFQEGYEINEAMLAGTIAGELSFLSREPRNTTAHADLDCNLWRLDIEAVKKLERESPSTFSTFLQMLLRASSEEQSSLMSYLVSRLS